jgi:PHS family inorganic phosphate transporter-like MFS transporter
LGLADWLQTKAEKLRYITYRLDQENGFDVRVFLVAASGFLTDSYILFVTNTVIPSIIYVYMHDKPDKAATFELWMNLSTLIGSIVGQIVFGILADIYGRTSLYGWELVIVIFATFNFAFTSEGVVPVVGAASLDLRTAFYCWRFLTGVGIGAEYPLSAVLTTEWASVDNRGQMVAAVFAMQPLGQLSAALAGLSAIGIVARIYDVQGDIKHSGTMYTESSRVAIDRVWRGVVLFGAIPSLIALLFRFYLPDPGRYTLEVQEDLDRAVNDTVTEIEKKNVLWRWTRSFWPWTKYSTENEDPIHFQGHEPRRDTDETADTGSTQLAESKHNVQSLTDLWTYLWEERNWTLLFGTCATWFLLDVVFYGLGISSPPTLAVVWASRPAPFSGVERIGPWNPDPTNPDDTIVDVLRRNSKRLIYTSVIGSLVGSMALILTINRVRRKGLLKWSFLVIAVFLFATGLSMRFAFASKNWRVTCAFYVICQVLFNYGKLPNTCSAPAAKTNGYAGPNTLTFLIPAEIFPTRYRCTLHGLSAASGKFGSVLIQWILHEVIRKESDQNTFHGKAMKLSWILIAFSIFMTLGFPITMIFLPEVQHGQRHESKTTLDKITFHVAMVLTFPIRYFLPNWKYEDRTLEDKTLEALAPGVYAAENDHPEVLGALWFRNHWPSFLSWRHWRRDQEDGNIRNLSLSDISQVSADERPDNDTLRGPPPLSTGPPSLVDAGRPSSDRERSQSLAGSTGTVESVSEGPSAASVPQLSQVSSAM